MMNFTFFTPTKLLFGRGKLNELGQQKMPGKKALLLISCGKSVRTKPAHSTARSGSSGRPAYRQPYSTGLWRTP